MTEEHMMNNKKGVSAPVNAGTKESWGLAKHDLLTTAGGSSWKSNWGTLEAPVEVDFVKLYQTVDATVTGAALQYSPQQRAALPKEAIAAASKRGYEVLNLMMEKGSPAKDFITRGSASGKIPLFSGLLLYKLLCDRWSAGGIWSYGLQLNNAATERYQDVKGRRR